MAGYNSVCEVLAAGRPALLVPRVRPRLEQPAARRRLAGLGLADVLDPELAARRPWGPARPPGRGRRPPRPGRPRRPARVPVWRGAAGRRRPVRARGGRRARRPRGGRSATSSRCTRASPRPSSSTSCSPTRRPGRTSTSSRCDRRRRQVPRRRSPRCGRRHLPALRRSAGGRGLGRVGAARGRAAGLPAAWATSSRRRGRRPAGRRGRGPADERGITHLHAHFASVATTVARLAARLAGVPYTSPRTPRTSSTSRSTTTTCAASCGCRRRRDRQRLQPRPPARTFGEAAARRRVYNGMDLARFPYAAPGGGRRSSRGRAARGEEGLRRPRRRLRAAPRDDGPVRLRHRRHRAGEQELRAQVQRLGLAGRRLLGRAPQDGARSLQAAAVFAAPCVVGGTATVTGCPPCCSRRWRSAPRASRRRHRHPRGRARRRDRADRPAARPGGAGRALRRLLDGRGLRRGLAARTRARGAEFDVHRRRPRCASCSPAPAVPARRDEGRLRVRRPRHPGVRRQGRLGARAGGPARAGPPRGGGAPARARARAAGPPGSRRRRAPAAGGPRGRRRASGGAAADAAVAGLLDALPAFDLVYERYALWGRTATAWAARQASPRAGGQRAARGRAGRLPRPRRPAAPRPWRRGAVDGRRRRLRERRRRRLGAPAPGVRSASSVPNGVDRPRHARRPRRRGDGRSRSASSAR